MKKSIKRIIIYISRYGIALTKKEIDKFYKMFIDIYTQREPEKLIEMFSEDVSVISGGSDYIMNNKEFLFKELIKEKNEAPDKLEIHTLSTNIQLVSEDTAIHTSITKWIVPMFEEKLESIGRMVFVFKKLEGKLRILHCSVSAPLSSTRQGEHFPYQEYEERARQLQELVDQKTVEIQKKDEIERKLIKENAELEIKRIEQEKDILKLELEKAKMELLFKENELVSYTMNLASKNDCFIFLEENIKSLKEKSGDDLNSGINTILTAMRSNISIEKEWENFQQKFSLLNQNFVNNLTSICPLLSKTELNICSLLRLQIDPKDIARFKYVSLSNIQNHIFRIRKKLNLERRDNIVKFLLNM